MTSRSVTSYDIPTLHSLVVLCCNVSRETFTFLSAYSRRRTHFQLKASRSSSIVFLFYRKSFCFDFLLYALAFSLLGWWSCEILNEFPSWEAWSVLLFDISVLVQLSVVFVGFVGIVSFVLIYCLFFWNYCIRCVFVQTTISVLFVWQYSYCFWFHYEYFAVK